MPWLSAWARRGVSLDYQGHCCWAYDTNWRNYALEIYIWYVRHMLAALDPSRVFVIGTSMGGFLEVGMGIAIPRTFVGIVINDSGPDIDGDALSKIIDFLNTCNQHFINCWLAFSLLRAFS